MPANPWELRADVRALDLAAEGWTEVGGRLTRRGDELVAMARRATDGWDAAAAESFEEHRRQVLANLDRFTDLASEIAASLRAVSLVLTSSQKELDRSWTSLAVVPHDVVGESRHLVFRPTADDERATVARGHAEAEEIRRRLTLSLDQEAARLRSARAELALVRAELTTLALSGAFTGGLPVGEESGVGAVASAAASVRGSAQSGVAALPPIAPVAVPVPDPTGVSSAGLISSVATSARGIGRRDARRTPASGVPPVGGVSGMGAGAMGARGGTMSRPDRARIGPRRLVASTLQGAAEDADSRLPRDRDAAGAAEAEAKRAAPAENRAERAARRAARASGRHEREAVDLAADGGPDAETDDVEDARRR